MAINNCRNRTEIKHFRSYEEPHKLKDNHSEIPNDFIVCREAEQWQNWALHVVNKMVELRKAERIAASTVLSSNCLGSNKLY